jgi:hypothetical protein
MSGRNALQYGHPSVVAAASVADLDCVAARASVDLIDERTGACEELSDLRGVEQDQRL